jgi:hypothetical protein
MIKDVIFFNNFGLYSQCELEATKRDQRLARFIADCIEAYLTKRGEAKTFKNKQQLFIACQQQADKEGISVAEFIEKCCAAFIGMNDKPAVKKGRGGFLDLNRDA